MDERTKALLQFYEIECKLWHLCIGFMPEERQVPPGWDNFALTRIHPIEDEL